MSHIQVRPDALVGAAAAFVRAGDAVADTAVEVASTKGAGDAAQQPAFAGAFDAMVSTWTHELRSMAHAITATGRATTSAGDAYTETDTNVIPGPRL
jgi:uncharacterized protein YukE